MEMDIAAMRVARYRFDLEAVDRLQMPAHQSSTFRGGFGHAFKKMVCFQPNWQACTPCARRNTCPYGYVFETSAPAEISAPLDLSDVTPPFVIEAPSQVRRSYQPGDRLGFDLLLIGEGMNYLPYFLIAFQELGRMGVGHPRGCYIVQRISAVHPLNGTQELVFDGIDVRVGRDLSLTGAEIVQSALQLPSDRIAIEFTTPTRIKYQQQYIRQPAFHVLVRALLRRVSALLSFHCGHSWNIDGRAIIAAAEQVATVGTELEWLQWDRFSGRQQQDVPMDGFVGRMIYQGPLAEFRTLLALGSLVHVGKATVFGHGHFRVTP